MYLKIQISIKASNELRIYDEESFLKTTEKPYPYMTFMKFKFKLNFYLLHIFCLILPYRTAPKTQLMTVHQIARCTPQKPTLLLIIQKFRNSPITCVNT